MTAQPFIPPGPGAFYGPRVPDADVPIVSVIVANRDGGRHLADALASASRQSLRAIEIIVVDDGSTDDSIARIQAFAMTEPRLRLLRNTMPAGPAAARNRALDEARGTWIAVLDSDDVMHPGRLAFLVDAAEADGADIVADNQIVFADDGSAPARPLLRGPRARAATSVGPADYIRSNRLSGRATPLGYLKPLFRRDTIERLALRYDPALRIAEDYDFVLRLLLAGASFRIHPRLTYFYRRHAASMSHRLSLDSIGRMQAADDRLRAASPPGALPPAVVAALDARRHTVDAAADFAALVDALKARSGPDAWRVLRARPATALLLRGVVLDRLRRRRPATSAPELATSEPAAAQRRVCVLSRQRITGANRGSTAYLLALCEALRNDGWRLDLVWPSPAVFGRWPLLALEPEMALFDTISVRGGVRLGRYVVATSPTVAVHAALAVADRLLARVGGGLGRLARKAPHAIAVPWTDADRLFVASHARAPGLVLADYAFLTEAIPFALRPQAPSAVVMHDLFSAQQTPGRPVLVELDEELHMLAGADAVLAIQATEAEVVAQALGAGRVIMAPVAFACVPASQPGDGRTVLFVGSDTLPNQDALTWLLDSIWPAVAEASPGARLVVAGAVCTAVRSRRSDVSLLGRVGDLAALYRDAAVVVSPLRHGSGLKVKLVEALAHGKAVVASSTTLQGVEHLAGRAAVRADDAAGFATAVTALLADPVLRSAQGTAALAAARREFSPAAATRGLLAFSRGERPMPTPASALVTATSRILDGVTAP